MGEFIVQETAVETPEQLVALLGVNVKDGVPEVITEADENGVRQVKVVLPGVDSLNSGQQTKLNAFVQRKLAQR